jgi:hypothetical protein
MLRGEGRLLAELGPPRPHSPSCSDGISSASSRAGSEDHGRALPQPPAARRLRHGAQVEVGQAVLVRPGRRPAGIPGTRCHRAG